MLGAHLGLGVHLCKSQTTVTCSVCLRLHPTKSFEEEQSKSRHPHDRSDYKVGFNSAIIMVLFKNTTFLPDCEEARFLG